MQYIRYRGDSTRKHKTKLILSQTNNLNANVFDQDMYFIWYLSNILSTYSFNNNVDFKVIVQGKLSLGVK